jgi:hypothetical protein
MILIGRGLSLEEGFKEKEARELFSFECSCIQEKERDPVAIG